MREINRRVVSGLLISKDGRIFLAKSNPAVGGTYANCWLIPGGGIEVGETEHDALVREIKEETSLDISNYQADLIDDTKVGLSEKTLKNTGERVLCHMQFVEYKVLFQDKNATEIDISLSEEHTEYKWFLPAELNGLELSPPTKELLMNMGYLLP